MAPNLSRPLPAWARRDPRLARYLPPATPTVANPSVAPAPLITKTSGRVTKQKKQNINPLDLFARLVATGIIVPKLKEFIKVPAEDKEVIHPMEMLTRDTWRIKQPGIVARLYGGRQCSGCSIRFEPQQTVRYSRHLDWHFRQNRRERAAAKHAQSQTWYLGRDDWMQYEEVEDEEKREKSWFEKVGASSDREQAPEEPSAAVSEVGAHCCATCGDTFHQFYKEDLDEWHLRNALHHQGDYFHPLCFEDYKAELAKQVAGA